MIPRKHLELIILSILSQTKEGMTGYAVTKEMNEMLGTNISPGTIYPKLNNLKEIGFVAKDDQEFHITEKGNNKMVKSIPNLLLKNSKFIPNLFRLLTNSLPFQKQSDFLKEIPFDFSFMNCFNLNHMFGLEEFDSCAGVSESLHRLKNMKGRLKALKKRIKQKYKKQMSVLDERLQEIDKKIEECKQETKEWVDIPIIDGDEQEDEKNE